MRGVLALIYVMLASQGFSQYNLEYFRNTFHASRSEEVLKTIIETTPNENNRNSLATIEAYKAVSEAMLADHQLSPFSKLQLFKSGKKKLEAIVASASIAEVHYLRLLVQLNVPEFLNYNDKIEEDLEFLFRELKNEDLPIDDKILFKSTLAKVTKDQEYLETINNISLN